MVRHLCAATFATNAANTNACAAGYSKITDDTTCKAAADFLVKPYGSNALLPFSLPSFPSGCYLDTAKSTVFLNTHPTGAAASTAQPLCKVTGAPPPTASSRAP